MKQKDRTNATSCNDRKGLYFLDDGISSTAIAEAVNKLKSVAEIRTFTLSYGSGEDEENDEKFAVQELTRLYTVLEKVKQIQLKFDNERHCKTKPSGEEIRNGILIETSIRGDNHDLCLLPRLSNIIDVIQRVLDEEQNKIKTAFFTNDFVCQDTSINIFFGENFDTDELGRIKRWGGYNLVTHYKEIDGVPMEYW